MIEVRVLGPLDVRRDGLTVDLRSARRRAILALLCSQIGKSVPLHVLVDGVWQEAPPPDALGTLRAHVSRLRSALGRDAVESSPGAYRLCRGVVTVDVDEFERLRADATAALVDGRNADAAEQLGRALATWRGPAYGDLADHPLLRPESVRLNECRIATAEGLAEARLACGPAREVVADLEALCAEQPWRERPHLLLMRALACEGRSREALRVGHRFRRRLADEAGLGASPVLERLEAEIAGGAAEMGSGDPGRMIRRSSPSETDATPCVSAALARPAWHRGGLPRPPAAFIGRDADVPAVLAALRRFRVVTLCGVGGVGKTRLAIEVATAEASAAGEVWFAPLGPFTSDGVVHAVAGAVGIVAERGHSVQDAIIEQLTDRSGLLVLDNCEHVIGSTAQLVSGLISTAPLLRILATSREPLDVAGENVYDVGPLAGHDRSSGGSALDAPAVALFVERARAARTEFVVDAGNLDAVVEICSRLDGLPLALEMAAARMRSMTPADLVARLDDRFRVLRGRRDDTEAHHHSLEAVFRWSYDLLSPGERRILTRASVFGGGFDLDAARSVCGAGVPNGGDTVEHLVALVDKSLVVADHRHGRARYHLLETVRAFALDRLSAAESAVVREAHARYFVDRLRHVGVQLASADEALAVSEIHLEFDNLRAAHRWAVLAQRTDVVADLLDALFDYALWRDRPECYDWARLAVEHLRRDDPRLAGAWAYLALAAPFGAAEHGEALRRASELHSKRDSGSDRCWPFRCALASAFVLNDSSVVERWITTDLVLADQDGRALIATYLLAVHSLNFGACGDCDRARALVDELADRARALGAPTALALALSAEARLVRDTDPRRAADLLEHALAHASAVESRRLAASIFGTLADVRARVNDRREVIEWLLEEWETRAVTGVAAETILTSMLSMCRATRAPNAVATLLGAIEARRGSRIASHGERREFSAARAALVGSMGSLELDRAASEGRALSDEALASLARAVARAATMDLSQSGKSAAE